MEGRYVHIVADLSHLSSPYAMSICSLGVMGSTYIRDDDPLPNVLELEHGTKQEIRIGHIYDSNSGIVAPIPYQYNLRQGSNPLSFV